MYQRWRQVERASFGKATGILWNFGRITSYSLSVNKLFLLHCAKLPLTLERPTKHWRTLNNSIPVMRWINKCMHEYSEILSYHSSFKSFWKILQQHAQSAMQLLHFPKVHRRLLIAGFLLPKELFVLIFSGCLHSCFKVAISNAVFYSHSCCTGWKLVFMWADELFRKKHSVGQTDRCQWAKSHQCLLNEAHSPPAEATLCTTVNN